MRAAFGRSPHHEQGAALNHASQPRGRAPMHHVPSTPRVSPWNNTRPGGCGRLRVAIRCSLEEILVMDIDRILNGEIRGMVREIREIAGIGRYSYRVIILANLDDWSQERLRKLTGGFPVSVCDHEHTYETLVFPVVAGTYFNASDLVIYVELSNKGARSKISYTVQTKHHECEITVLFVPIAEVARLMGRYKNSILKYNPRSYIEYSPTGREIRGP
jgi:hypothetical protein